MSLLRLTASGGIAAAMLLIVELVWLSARDGRILAFANGPLGALVALGPRAILLGLGLGLFEALLLRAIGAASARCARWRGSAEQWSAASVAALVTLSLGTCSYFVLGGRQVAAVGGRTTIMAVIVPMVAWLTYQATLSAHRLIGWMEDATTEDRRRRRAAKWIFVGATAGLALALHAFDRTVFVRRYEAFHLALRAAMFVGLELAGFVSMTTLDRAPRSPVAVRRQRSAALVVAAVLLASELHGMHRAAHAAALAALRLHGAVGAVLPAMWDAPSSRPAAAASRLSKAGLAAPAGGEPLAPAANVLLVTVDALRADHLGTYGYRRATSPFIDRLAQTAVVFERAYTSAPHTSYALASLLTGRPAMSLSELGVFDGTTTLADLARAAGYYTAAFFTPAVYFVDEDHFRRFRERGFGFDQVVSEDLPEATSAPLLTRKVLAFLASEAPSRFLLWVHYFAPHEPYVEHPEAGPPFGGSGLDRYDAEIRWTDQAIGGLVEGVRASHPNTIVVLAADHGEEFGEHGGAYHGTTLYDEQLRVPLILSVPGVPARRVPGPVSTTSIVPTILDVVGAPLQSEHDGRSLAPWLSGGADAPAGEEGDPAFAENAGQKMVAAGHDKLICATRSDRCALFDLKSDPGELVDVSPFQPARAVEMKALLAAWEDRQELSSERPAGMAALSDPSAEAGSRRVAARALARLPRLARPPQLRRMFDGELDPVVKGWLAVALGAVGDTEARGMIPDILAGVPDADDELRGHAALARSGAGAAEAAAAELAGALRRAVDVNLRCALIEALGRLGSDAAAAAVMAEYDVIRSRICCGEALASLRRSSTVPFILARLPREPYVTVQSALVRALGGIGDERAIPVLRALRADTAEPKLLAAIDDALGALEQARSGT